MDIASSKLEDFVICSKEVLEAFQEGKPVIALASSMFTHDIVYPDNFKILLEVEETVRKNGVVPATVAVIDGKVRVGMTVM